MLTCMMTKKLDQLIIGATTLVIGLGFLLDAMNVWDFGQLFQMWWPVLLIIGGIGALLGSRDNWLWATLFIVAGGLLLLNTLDLYPINAWELFWPIAIIGVGLAVLFNSSSSRMRTSKAQRSDVVAVLGENRQINDGSEFEASKITSVMGGAALDLRKANITKDAIIEVVTLWGGVEIYLPKNVTIKNEIMPILGGVENKTEQSTTKNSATVTIIGQAIMAGVEIRN